MSSALRRAGQGCRKHQAGRCALLEELHSSVLRRKSGVLLCRSHAEEQVSAAGHSVCGFQRHVYTDAPRRRVLPGPHAGSAQEEQERAKLCSSDGHCPGCRAASQPQVLVFSSELRPEVRPSVRAPTVVPLYALEPLQAQIAQPPCSWPVT